MTPTEYEQAVVEFFRTEWPPPGYIVRHNIRLPGRKSGGPRQIDVSIFAAGSSTPFLIAEAKRHGRRIDVGKAGSLIALVQDIGGVPTVMVSTAGFSGAAQNHLWSEGIGDLVITARDAAAWRWLSALDSHFRIDCEFRRVSGDLVEALRHGDSAPFLDADVPYEEWLAIVAVGLASFPAKTSEVLRVIAREHYDDGWRFNAVQHLVDAGQMSLAELDEVIRLEAHPENVELFGELRAELAAGPA